MTPRDKARKLMRDAARPLPPGRPVTLPDAVRITLHVPRAEAIRWRMEANAAGISMAEYIRGRMA